MGEERTMSDFLDGKLCMPHHVVYRDFVEETVMLNLDTGTYHGLNSTAGHVLRAIEAGSFPREIAAEMARTYGRDLQEVRQDVTALCEALLTRGLLVRDEAR